MAKIGYQNLCKNIVDSLLYGRKVKGKGKKMKTIYKIGLKKGVQQGKSTDKTQNKRTNDRLLD